MKIGLILSVLVNVVLTLFLVLPKSSSQNSPQGFKRFCEKEGLVNCSYNDGYFIDGEKNIYKFENGNFKWDKVLTDSVRKKASDKSPLYTGDEPGFKEWCKDNGYSGCYFDTELGNFIDMDGNFYTYDKQEGKYEPKK